LFIAVDANPDLLTQIARQAGRKASRGGVSNLLCLAAAAETLACELPGVADQLSIILPWGRLLRSVAQPDLDDLRHIAALGRAKATIEIVFSYDAGVDAQSGGLLGGLSLDEDQVHCNLPSAYRQAGLDLIDIKPLPLADLRAYPTTWAKRLAFGRPRQVWRLVARRKA
jgi:16S rRNA (adenine(1408)-N(1))-methyltransferase